MDAAITNKTMKEACWHLSLDVNSLPGAVVFACVLSSLHARLRNSFTMQIAFESVWHVHTIADAALHTFCADLIAVLPEQVLT